MHIHISILPQVALVVKNPPGNAGDPRDLGSIPGLGSSPGGGMTTHSSILAWRTSWTEDLMGYSPQAHKEPHNTEESSLGSSEMYVKWLLIQSCGFLQICPQPTAFDGTAVLGNSLYGKGSQVNAQRHLYFTAQHCLTASILIAPQFELKNYEEQTLQGNLASPSVERG